jgi:hypothetical protein
MKNLVECIYIYITELYKNERVRNATSHIQKQMVENIYILQSFTKTRGLETLIPISAKFVGVYIPIMELLQKLEG